ncbi:MAG TPA: prepilin-type N-terminal cleavage/methylation domain-containing protein [Burkholderiaceae bacterium]|nr:prepilin-type N-terminal cleavage/methylation domain-containing protein [Burkholderiaceae bacterium]
MTSISRRAARGFTLVELMVVMALIAIAVAVGSLALRDPAATRLEREAVRLSALLESARAEARSLGLPVRWQPLPLDPQAPQGDQFRFIGLPSSTQMPTHWLGEGVVAQVIGATAVRLGPEATIGSQRIVLRLDQQSVVLSTDGIGPFVITGDAESVR